MAGSIKGFWEKIKAAGVSILADREIFAGMLIVVVGVASFGLGRLSVGQDMPAESAGFQMMGNAAQKGGAAPEGVRAVSGASAVSSTEVQADTETKNDESVSSAPLGEKAYVGSKNSTKYHLPWCSGAKRIAEENKVWFATKEEAEAAGNTPAGNCKGI